MGQSISNMIAALPTISKILFVVFVMFLTQALAGVYQWKNYTYTMKKLHKLGNVGIGQRKGSLFNSNIVMIACDNEGIILGAEILDGFSFLAKFHEINTFLDQELIGSSIYDFLAVTDEFDKKKRKKYQGWIRALEAIRMRFENNAAKEEEEYYEDEYDSDVEEYYDDEEVFEEGEDEVETEE